MEGAYLARDPRQKGIASVSTGVPITTLILKIINIKSSSIYTSQKNISVSTA